MGRFDEKIMLVTGATSGIGRAVAIRAAKEGATVVAVGRNEERGAAVVAAMEEAGGKGEFMKCDVSNKDAVKALFAEIQEKYGKLDVAVNNAGIVGASKTVEELEDDDWFQVIDANLNSCFFCCREEVKLMQPSGGAIVNVSSVAGMRGFPSAAAYVASKHAVSGLTKAVAVDYATKGITCNAICPAGTDAFINPMAFRQLQDGSSIQLSCRIIYRFIDISRWIAESCKFQQTIEFFVISYLPFPFNDFCKAFFKACKVSIGIVQLLLICICHPRHF